MRRFLASALVAGTAVALTLVGGSPASAGPGPWPPDIQPPLCIPKDQSDGTYEWQYEGTKRLGQAIAYKFEIGYATPVINNFTLTREVTCGEESGRVGSGLNLGEKRR